MSTRRVKDPRRVPGGVARAAALTPERRREIARAAAAARWAALGGPGTRRAGAATVRPSASANAAPASPGRRRGPSSRRAAGARDRDGAPSSSTPARGPFAGPPPPPAVTAAAIDVLQSATTALRVAAFDCELAAQLLEAVARRLRGPRRNRDPSG